MLYVSTRNHNDPYTAARTLNTDFAPDGGLFAPYHLPKYEREEIWGLKDLSFGNVVSRILNVFYSNAVKASDVDFSIGRTPLRCVGIGHRVIVAELWRNTAQNYAFIERQLNQKLNPHSTAPTIWVKTAIRVAVLFGVYAQLLANGQLLPDQPFDISLDADDRVGLMASLYSKSMGLPLESVILGCGDSDALWQLLHQNEIDTRTLSDAQKLTIELLLHFFYGDSAVQSFLSSASKGEFYTAQNDPLSVIGGGVFAAVVSSKRIPAMIRSIYHSNHYFIGLETIAPYGALQDFRAKSGESRPTLICVNTRPLNDLNVIADAVGMPVDQIRASISNF